VLGLNWRTDLTAEDIARKNPDHEIVKAWRKAEEELEEFTARHRRLT
jgi:hypothetical protein